MDGVVGSNRSSSVGVQAPAFWPDKWELCWHEPRIHDHELYFLLNQINLFAMVPICFVGLFVNATALVCLYRPPKITSGVFAYLKLMLILDMAQLLVTTLTYMTKQVCDYNHSPKHTFYTPCFVYFRFFQYVLPRLEMSVNTMHSWTIAALSAHRYWKIARPVVSRFNDTLGRAHCVLFVLIVGAIFFRLPLFTVELRFVNTPVMHIDRSPWTTVVMSWYRVIYHSILDPLLARIVPLLTMSAFSLLTLFEICRSRDFGYHKLKVDVMINGKNGSAGGGGQNGAMLTNGAEMAPLSACFKRRRSNATRQKQELRATVSIILIIVLYLALHAMELFLVVRKWDLLISGKCPGHPDYLISHVSLLLSLVSASINAFVFIAFTNRLKSYLEMLIRKTSRNLSSSSDVPHSPRVTMLEPICLFELEDSRKYNDTPL